MTAFNVQMIPVNTIAAPSYVRQQNGHDKESLNQLAASIKQQGLLQPIVVRPEAPEEQMPGSTCWVVIAGRRRLAAFKLAGLTDIPAVVADTDEARSYEMEIAENIQREQMTLADTARAVRTLMTIYNNAKKVAEILNKSPAWVSKHLAVTSSNCPTTVAEMLDQGIITDLETLVLLKQIAETPASHPDAFRTLQRMISLAQAGNMNRQIARDALAKLREKKPQGTLPHVSKTLTTRTKVDGDDSGAEIDPRTVFNVELPIVYLERLERLGGSAWIIAALDAAEG